jgi:hypothetical protein
MPERDVSWAEFADAAPQMAAAGQGLIFKGEQFGKGLLATVSGAEPPRIYPVGVAIFDGRLLTFISRSAKRTDLEQDGRSAL